MRCTLSCSMYGIDEKSIADFLRGGLSRLRALLQTAASTVVLSPVIVGLAPSSLSFILRYPRRMSCTRVFVLEFGDLLIVERHRRAAVAPFTDEVELDGRLVVTESAHVLEIDRFVAPGFGGNFGRLGGTMGGDG